MALVTPTALSGVRTEVRDALTKRDRNTMGLVIQALMLLAFRVTSSSPPE